jgi:hypothetical protein
MDLNKSQIYVNGPINFFRLKNNNKDIYLFSDIHKDLNNQTECDEINSINVDKFFLNFFKNNKKQVDFMLETYKDYQNNCESQIYLVKLRKMFNSFYKKNPYYENLRIHYLDIRNYKYLEQIHQNSYYLIDYLKSNNIYKFKTINEKLDTIKFYLNKIMDYYVNNLDKSYNTDKENIFENLLDKIMNKYNNVDNKQKINKILETNFYKKIKYTNELITNLKIKLNEYSINIENSNKKDKYVVCNKNKKDYEKYIYEYSFYKTKEYYDIKYEINNKCSEIKEQVDIIKLTIMDCYFLRRFLDKDYITNNIVYTGFIHTIEYLYFLVKYYDFKIIEMDDKNSYTIKELNNIIKNNNSIYDVINILLSKQSFKQCIKINKLFN